MLIRTQLARRMGQHVDRELYDDSRLAPAGIAIYSLADPRELLLSRYIGQTAAPAFSAALAHRAPVAAGGAPLVGAATETAPTV